jgi:sulfite reductase beta subunit-like hemoprotein
MTVDAFNDEQKRYLEGFLSGVQTSRVAAGLKPLGGLGGGTPQHSGPDAVHLNAMARTEAEGKKLSNEEKAKRDDNPLDAYERLKSDAETGQFPKGVDNFRWRYHGLFYVAPAQDAFMCRLRIPPVNIHLTGCHHSCAQHYIGDLGLIACKAPVVPDSEDMVDGFHIHAGGGFGPDAAIAREIVPNVKTEDCPAAVLRVLKRPLPKLLRCMAT